MTKTIEIPIELADCIKCGKELPAFIEKMSKKEGCSINKACQYVERVTEGAIKAETARQAHKRNRGIGTNVPKKPESSISEERETSRKSQGGDADRTVASFAPKACCTLNFVEWQPVRHLQVSGWYGGLASNKIRGRCDELKSKFVSLHCEMIKFFRNDANASKEKISREDWKRLHEETKQFATWLFGVSQGMGKAAGIIKIQKET